MLSLLKRRTQRAPSIYDIPGPKGKWFIGDAMKFDADPIAGCWKPNLFMAMLYD